MQRNRRGKMNVMGLLTIIVVVFVWLVPRDTPATLVAQWQFNGDLTDSSGSGHTASFNGGTAGYVPASGGQAIVLDGVDDFLNVPASGNNLDFSGNSFTIAAWLTVHAVPTARRGAVIGGKADFSNFANYALTVDYFNFTNTVENIAAFGYTRRTSGANASVVTTLYFTPAEDYVNAILTFDAPTKTLKIYRNGILRDTLTAADISGPVSTAGDFLMGKGYDATFLRADLDELQVYNQSLDQSLVTILYNNGNGPVTLPVPEPSAVALLGMALGVLGLRKRIACRQPRP